MDKNVSCAETSAEDERRSGLASPLGEEIRIERKERHYVGLEADVAAATGSVTVTLLDLSDEGFKAATRATFEIGSFVKVLLPNSGWKLAQVRWALPGSFGAHFQGPLRPRKLDAARPRRECKRFNKSSRSKTTK